MSGPPATNASGLPFPSTRGGSSMRYLFLFTLTGCLFGQTFQGGVRGTVADVGGAMVPEAKVSLIDEATSLQRVTLTSDSGEFVFSALNPATYRVVVETPGFKKLERRGVVVNTQE